MNCLRELLRPGSVDHSAPNVPIPSAEFVGPMERIPANRAEVLAVYGDPGFAKSSRQFQRRRMTVAKGLPGNWNKGRSKLFCHELVEPYLREALRRADEKDALKDVERIGCYVHRHQRHDPRRPLSYHSWGIAIDIDPSRNKVAKFSAVPKPEPFTDEWYRWWPKGLSEELVLAFEGVGWTWGGRWKRFVDPMHMQLVD